MESGQVSRWNKKEGDKFTSGDIFCEVQTDKATVDFEAQDDGVVAKILAEAGTNEVKCGDPILIVVQDEGDVAAFKDYVLEGALSVSTSKAPAPAVESLPSSASDAASPAAPSSPPPGSAAAPVASAATTAAEGKIMASPLAFKLAKEQGYDIAAILGTGPGGRIIADDVREYVPMSSYVAATPAAATTVAAPAAAIQVSASPLPPDVGAGYTDYPLSQSALATATRLTQSKRNVPHYYLTVDLKLDALLKFRSSLNEALSTKKDDSPVISLNDLLLKAVACSMKTVPEANASWMDTFVRVYDNVDINVVVGGGEGLYAPVIKNVNSLGIRSIGDEFASVSRAAEEGTLTAEASAIGTFSVVNLGMYGIKSAAPIIMEPQACMLALGAAENRIIPKENPVDEIDVYQQSVLMTVTLSCDHRVVDGAVGAKWLSAFKNHVENPNTLLL